MSSDARKAAEARGDETRKRMLVDALELSGSVAGAAKLLDVSERTAWRWVREFGIEPPRKMRGT